MKGTAGTLPCPGAQRGHQVAAQPRALRPRPDPPRVPGEGRCHPKSYPRGRGGRRGGSPRGEGCGSVCCRARQDPLRAPDPRPGRGGHGFPAGAEAAGGWRAWRPRRWRPLASGNLSGAAAAGGKFPAGVGGEGAQRFVGGYGALLAAGAAAGRGGSCQRVTELVSPLRPPLPFVTEGWDSVSVGV